ncbi:hypothetical protein [Paracoccus xiamenensis]|uniref:hypothetical protein n=1 Tax=Paracoccus xiamenensis TaxID=2714901 RepID=UPI00140C672B|nr:hypothetical protein [Paracoccus xiamenensis]NHF72445.1 hypothetical protein [Paracoccus xiamenensis]
MRAALIFICLAAPSLPAFADVAPLSAAACLPPIPGNAYDPDKCVLAYHPPPSLKQDVEITDCSFLAGEMGDGRFKLLYCSIFNKSSEAIESIRYGVRYLEKGRETPLVQAGFQGPNLFKTANIPGDLQPGEARVLLFAGPGLPESGEEALIVPMIEVLGVRVPGSFALR